MKNETKKIVYRTFLYLLMAAFWIPFLYSAWSYQKESWFVYLLASRWCLFLIPILYSIFNIVVRFNSDHFEQNYYLVAMMVQASHGILEPTGSNDFYSFISLFLLFIAITYKGNTKQWCLYYMPFVVVSHVVPLMFKDSLFFSSLGYFVDKFSFNVSLILLSVINVKISINRSKLYQLLIKEKDDRFAIIERELGLAK